MNYSARYSRLCYSANERGIPNELSLPEYIKIVECNECDYCKAELTITGYQVDRKNNKGYYSLDNCVPCCSYCNYKKGDKLTYEEMKLLSDASLPPDPSLEEKTFNGIEVNIIGYDSQIKPKPATPLSITFYKKEFEEKRDVCLSIISAKAGTITERLFARKLEVREVPIEELRVFLNTNHLKGYSKAPAVGLYSGDELYTILSYKRYKTGELEVYRLATKNYHIVVGGFSKLLKHLTREFEVFKIFSFVDRRFHMGNSLIRLNFELEPKLSKSWYWTDGTDIFNRLRCRANMDSRRLPEKEYAEELGWWRIYDAGQQKFILNVDTRITRHSNYDVETWGQLSKRLLGCGLKVVTTYEDYKLLDRHKTIEIKCVEKDHQFFRMRYRLAELTDCSECKGLRRKTSFTEVIGQNKWVHKDGEYQDKYSYLNCVCPEGHILRRQYRWFRDNTCPNCNYANSKMLRRVSDALGGSPIERKRNVYEQIKERCQQTNQVLLTSWEEFKFGKKTSATIPIQIRCKHDHVRPTIWQVAKEHGCGCIKCRGEKKKKDTPRKTTKEPLNDVPFDDGDFETGKVYGHLTVKEIITAKTVICECVCGEETVTTKYKLVRQKIKSCGCKQWDKNEEKPAEGKDKLPKNVIENKLKSLGYERLSGCVVSDNSRIEVRCLGCQKESVMNWCMIRGTCKNCYHKGQAESAYNRVVEQANSKSYAVIDSFEAYFYNCENKTASRNSLVKIKSECPNGHPVQITSASAAKVKWRCVDCIKNKKG